MSEPNWRELGDPWADRLPPRPRTKPVDPVIAWVGDVAVIHGERDDSEMCLCGAPDYLTCPDWIAEMSISVVDCASTSADGFI